MKVMHALLYPCLCAREYVSPVLYLGNASVCTCVGDFRIYAYFHLCTVFVYVSTHTSLFTEVCRCIYVCAIVNRKTSGQISQCIYKHIHQGIHILMFLYYMWMSRKMCGDMYMDMYLLMNMHMYMHMHMYMYMNSHVYVHLYGGGAVIAAEPCFEVADATHVCMHVEINRYLDR